MTGCSAAVRTRCNLVNIQASSDGGSPCSDGIVTRRLCSTPPTVQTHPDDWNRKSLALPTLVPKILVDTSSQKTPPIASSLHPSITPLLDVDPKFRPLQNEPILRLPLELLTTESLRQSDIQIFHHSSHNDLDLNLCKIHSDATISSCGERNRHARLMDEGLCVVRRRKGVAWEPALGKEDVRRGRVVRGVVVDSVVGLCTIKVSVQNPSAIKLKLTILTVVPGGMKFPKMVIPFLPTVLWAPDKKTGITRRVSWWQASRKGRSLNPS